MLYRFEDEFGLRNNLEAQLQKPSGIMMISPTSIVIGSSFAAWRSIPAACSDWYEGTIVVSRSFFKFHLNMMHLNIVIDIGVYDASDGARNNSNVGIASATVRMGSGLCSDPPSHLSRCLSSRSLKHSSPSYRLTHYSYRCASKSERNPHYLP